MNINLTHMRDRLRRGLPLPLDQQRWLLEQCTGYPVTRERLCENCRGETCGKCDGLGYVLTAGEPVEVVG